MAQLSKVAKEAKVDQYGILFKFIWKTGCQIILKGSIVGSKKSHIPKHFNLYIYYILDFNIQFNVELDFGSIKPNLLKLLVL